MTSALTCPLGPAFTLPAEEDRVGVDGAAGRCRSSAITDAKVGDIRLDATDDLGDRGDDARGGGGDVVRAVAVEADEVVVLRGLHGMI